MITPCIKICRIEKNVCIGCGRTLDEISKWISYSDQERQQIIDRLKYETHIRN
jgi:predicted Fe-S protein YdhL (DUF1289 family)